jgi:hypothetical protein
LHSALNELELLTAGGITAAKSAALEMVSVRGKLQHVQMVAEERRLQIKQLQQKENKRDAAYAHQIQELRIQIQQLQQKDITSGTAAACRIQELQAIRAREKAENATRVKHLCREATQRSGDNANRTSSGEVEESTPPIVRWGKDGGGLGARGIGVKEPIMPLVGKDGGLSAMGMKVEELKELERVMHEVGYTLGLETQDNVRVAAHGAAGVTTEGVVGVATEGAVEVAIQDAPGVTTEVTVEVAIQDAPGITTEDVTETAGGLATHTAAEDAGGLTTHTAAEAAGVLTTHTAAEAAGGLTTHTAAGETGVEGTRTGDAYTSEGGQGGVKGSVEMWQRLLTRHVFSSELNRADANANNPAQTNNSNMSSCSDNKSSHNKNSQNKSSDNNMSDHPSMKRGHNSDTRCCIGPVSTTPSQWEKEWGVLVERAFLAEKAAEKQEGQKERAVLLEKEVEKQVGGIVGKFAAIGVQLSLQKMGTTGTIYRLDSTSLAGIGHAGAAFELGVRRGVLVVQMEEEGYLNFLDFLTEAHGNISKATSDLTSASYDLARASARAGAGSKKDPGRAARKASREMDGKTPHTLCRGLAESMCGTRRRPKSKSARWSTAKGSVNGRVGSNTSSTRDAGLLQVR